MVQKFCALIELIMQIFMRKKGKKIRHLLIFIKARLEKLLKFFCYQKIGLTKATNIQNESIINSKVIGKKSQTFPPIPLTGKSFLRYRNIKPCTNLNAFFPHFIFGLNTERYGVSLRIQSDSVKMWGICGPE